MTTTPQERKETFDRLRKAIFGSLNLLDQYRVGDSYDLWSAATNYHRIMQDRILQLENKLAAAENECRGWKQATDRMATQVSAMSEKCGKTLNAAAALIQAAELFASRMPDDPEGCHISEKFAEAIDALTLAGS